MARFTHTHTHTRARAHTHIFTHTSLFSQVIRLTQEHRLETSESERARCIAAGADVAPANVNPSDPAAGAGPLRVWPGGLAVSRSIG